MKPVNPLLRTQAFINGTWVGQPTLPVVDPATGLEIAKVPDLEVVDMKRAIDAAHLAFFSWSKKLAQERSQLLRRWYELICENVEDLADILTREQGKPLSEARAEILYGAGFIEFFAEEAKRVYGEIIPPFKEGSKVIVLKQPLGVIGAITPWNFPNAMIARKISPALAAGCTVVCKPAEETPLSALALVALAEKAGIPPGVLNVITTSKPEALGAELTENIYVNGITFTGSTAVGRILMKQAAGTIKKISLELGGNAPFIVFEDADLEAAVAGLVACKFRNAGQTCVCANRIFIHDNIYDKFVSQFLEATKRLRVGPGTNADTQIGPLINQAAIQKIKLHIEDAISGGAKLLLGGNVHNLGQTFFEPTILSDIKPTMKVMHEETFGPLAPLMRFKHDEDVIKLANKTSFGLAGYFYTQNLKRAWQIAEALEVGVVGINSGIVSSEVVPFGGVKQSGIGREGSHFGINEFVETKYILMSGL